MQLLVAYEASLVGLTVHSHVLETFAYAIFLELDEAIERLLQHCCDLGIDIDQTLSQGADARAARCVSAVLAQLHAHSRLVE